MEVFTPDMLQELLAMHFPHDVELVDHELLVFRQGYAGDRIQLDQEFKCVALLVSHLARQLDRVSFSPIGHHPPQLG